MRDYGRSTPWGLTPAQVRTMDAVLELGTNRAAARRLKVKPRSVEMQVYLARKSITAADPNVNIVSRLSLLRLWMDYRALNPVG